MWKVKDWILKENILNECLSGNNHPYAMQLLEESPSLINWYMLSCNPSAIHILEKKENYENINWTQLSENSQAIDLLKNNMNKINWNHFSLNKHPEAIKLLERKIIENKIYINWVFLSENSKCIHILKNNYKYISWYGLSSNESDEAIEMLNNPQNINKINWNKLSTNSKAIKLIKDEFNKTEQYYWLGLCCNKNIEKIVEHFDIVSTYKIYNNRTFWTYLCQNEGAINIIKKLILEDYNKNLKLSYLAYNPSIFEYDYQTMKKNMWINTNLGKELTEYWYHPTNMHKWPYWKL